MSTRATKAEKIKFATEEAKRGKSYAEIVKDVVAKYGEKESSAGYYAWYGMRNLKGRPVPLVKPAAKSVISTTFARASPERKLSHATLKQWSHELGEVFGFRSRERSN